MGSSEEVIGSPLDSKAVTDALSALEDFTGEERDKFYETLDELPNFDTPQQEDPDRYDINAEDWEWITTAVGSRCQTDVVQFAQDEFDRLHSDPDLVRRPPAALLWRVW